MSNTYSIGCRECKKHLWIAQDKCLYSGDFEAMERLEIFLFEHQGHALVFEDNVNSDIAEWDEVKWEESTYTPCVLPEQPKDQYIYRAIPGGLYQIIPCKLGVNIIDWDSQDAYISNSLPQQSLKPITKE